MSLLAHSNGWYKLTTRKPDSLSLHNAVIIAQADTASEWLSSRGETLDEGHSHATEILFGDLSLQGNITLRFVPAYPDVEEQAVRGNGSTSHVQGIRFV